MKILLSIIIAVFFTACNSYNDLAADAAKSGDYSPDCIIYATPNEANSSISQEGLTMFITKLEACKTREMMNNFAN